MNLGSERISLHNALANCRRPFPLRYLGSSKTGAELRKRISNDRTPPSRRRANPQARHHNVRRASANPILQPIIGRKGKYMTGGDALLDVDGRCRSQCHHPRPFFPPTSALALAHPFRVTISDSITIPYYKELA